MDIPIPRADQPQSLWKRLRTQGRAASKSLIGLPPERLIVYGRCISLLSALIAIYLDPTDPNKDLRATYVILLGYIAYSICLVLTNVYSRPQPRAVFVSHAIDMAVLGLLCFRSGELDSPFLTFFTFTIITAAIRWGLRGSLITALLLALMLAAVGWPYDDPAHSDLNGMIMQSTYALVAATMLGYLSSHRERARQQLENLASWPIGADGNDGLWLANSMRHASTVLEGAPILVLWEGADEGTGAALWADGEHKPLSPTADQIRAGVAGGSCVASFQFGMPAAPDFLAALIADNLPDAGRNPKLRLPRFCSSRFETAHFTGRIFVIHPRRAHDDVLSLTAIAALRIASELERRALADELAATAGWQERIRLGRELHDSVLQDLTAANLQLKLTEQQGLAKIRATTGIVGKILAEQQSRIRRFVEESRTFIEAPDQPLARQISHFRQLLCRQWNCQIEANVEPSDIIVGPVLASDICQILSEATANAVRHGQAKKLQIRVRADSNHIDLMIQDDGRGLPANSGAVIQPRSISDRVAALGGEIGLANSPTGLRLDVRLPRKAMAEA